MIKPNAPVSHDLNNEVKVGSDSIEWVTETVDVSAVYDDGVELSLAPQQSACGGCSAKSQCGQSAMASALAPFVRPSVSRTLRVSRSQVSPSLYDPLSHELCLKAGDRVVIGLPKHRLVQATLLMYILPLLGAVLGAIMGYVATVYWPASPEVSDLYSIVGAVVGVLWVVFGLKRFSRNPFSQKAFEPVLLQKADE